MNGGLAVALAAVMIASPSGEFEPKLTRATVATAAALILDEYFDPVLAGRADAMLKERLTSRRYAGARSERSLAALMTHDLYATTHDKHLVVSVVPATLPKPRSVVGARENFGVQRAEILDGNVGYLHLTSFYHPEEAREAIAAAMKMLCHADALIVDMRDNAGGSPETVALVASYLFDEPELPLFAIVPRSGHGGGRYATEAPGVPERNGSRPVYVLTAARTFSAGEGMAFILQERGRAEIVGERTAGAANPGRPYRINDRFEITIPNGKVVSAVRGGNWEGVGVIPDVAVPASEALRVALRRARVVLLKE